MKELNLKQRVFIDVIEHVPYGSNKMTSGTRVIAEYEKELEQNEEVRNMFIETFEERRGEKFDENAPFHNWFLGCDLSHKAYKDVHDAERWLVENGYLRRWDKKARFGVIVYYGLTAKGWKVADSYIKLAKESRGK